VFSDNYEQHQKFVTKLRDLESDAPAAATPAAAPAAAPAPAPSADPPAAETKPAPKRTNHTRRGQ